MSESNGTLQVELTSPEHAPVKFAGGSVVIPGAAGIFTVLPGHTRLLTRLTHGVVVVYGDGDEADRRYLAVHGGYAEISDDKITVLADTMERAEDIDLRRAEAAADRARERLLKPASDTDVLRAEAALARALARMRAHAGEEY